MRPPSSWLQVVSQLDPKFGGIASSLPMLCRSAERGGVQSPVLGFCAYPEFKESAVLENLNASCVPASRLRWMVDPSLRRRLRESVRKADGLHIHGLWETHTAVAASAAQSCRRPYIVSAHGMLERWALQHKRVKKALYAALIETGNLRGAACLRALTIAEVEDYRRIGLTNPIAVVPNGVAVPAFSSPDAFLQLFPELADKHIVLFMGRLHPKKGLRMLLQALARVRSSRENVHLVLAGPDCEDTRAQLEAQAAELGISGQITFTGMLTGPVKWSALAAAKLFVLPSFSEGFSVAVIEALGMKLPVIVTRQCNFPEVAEKSCGWVIEAKEFELEDALDQALRAHATDLTAMGQRGQALVESRYSWQVVGQKMADVYKWVLGGPRPSNVETVE